MSDNSSNHEPGGRQAQEELTCRELIEVVSGYLEGTMPAAMRLRFEAHLAACPWCVTYVEQMRGTIDALGELSEDSLDPATREELVKAFRDWHDR